MKASVLFLAASSLLLGCLSNAQAQYKLDDGTAENAYGFGNGTTNSGSIWLNEFTVTGGLNRITSIQIAWGNPGGANENVNGLPMNALLYTDPNGDGSPLDGVLVGNVAGTIQSVGTNAFVTYTLPAAVTINTPNFFIGYYVPGFADISGVQQYFAAINTSTGNIPSRSFIYGNGDGTTPSLTNLSSNTVGGSLTSLGIAGNWLVRATAVPEPGTWALMALAGGVTVVAYARRARAARA